MTIAAGVALFTVGGRVLLLKRLDGTWGFPAGMVEEGELPQACALRELQEETGRGYGDVIGYLGARQIGPVLFFPFLCLIDKEYVPALNHEHTEYMWATDKTMPKPLHPGLAEILNQVITDAQLEVRAMDAAEEEQEGDIPVETPTQHMKDKYMYDVDDLKYLELADDPADDDTDVDYDYESEEDGGPEDEDEDEDDFDFFDEDEDDDEEEEGTLRTEALN